MLHGHCRHDDRGILGIEGPDSRSFLQGIISNDIDKLTTDRSLYAALLTPQGKYLFDFFLYDDGARVLLDAQAARLAELKQRLLMYRLRAKVEIQDLSESLAVFSVLGETVADRFGLERERGAAKPMAQGAITVDPRLAELGLRAILPRDVGALAEFEPLDPDLFARHRMKLGIAEGEPDLVPQKSLLLESNFEELSGVDFKKGCFVGQELTARTKYRGLVRKRILPVEIEGDAAISGTPVMAGEREVGELRSRSGDRGLGLIRLDRFDLDQPAPDLECGGDRLRIQKPDWLSL